MDYRIWALASAFFAGLTAVLSKKGVEDVPSNLALAVRVTFVLLVTVGIAFATHQTKLGALTGRHWWLLFLSAMATGASWLCYFKALQLGPISRVAPIDKLSFVLAMVLGVVVLREKVSLNLVVGAALVVAGVLITLR
ncbi:MAG: EamA family transporter [Fimbriimonadaceae bacterium]|nr:EamA family transporter [Fimbriimonadaceae bacterium]